MSNGSLETGVFRYTGSISAMSAESRVALMRRTKESDAEVREATANIIRRVRTEGDSALIEMARDFDGVELAALEVSRKEIERAIVAIDPALRTALERAARNIQLVHSASPAVAVEIEPEPGVIVGRRPDPLKRVGAYAPGGRAAYASSVLMCAVPARAAGVEEIIVCSPPEKNGVPSDVVLAACAIARVDRVFAVGGAGAIAAMAYGTDTIPVVDKIVGPGNAYVAEAKVQVSRVVGIDSPAGPSELMIIADNSCNAEGIAAEVLAQAEHDPDACVVVVALSASVAERNAAAVEDELPLMLRSRIAGAALKSNGAILLARDEAEAIAFAAEYAPEHLLLAVSNASEVAARTRNAGCVFIGEESSVVFGDYISGGNHVLPTAGAARSYSGLGALDFVRWTSYQCITADAAAGLSADVEIMATAEGLSAHAAAAGRWRSL